MSVGKNGILRLYLVINGDGGQLERGITRPGSTKKNELTKFWLKQVTSSLIRDYIFIYTINRSFMSFELNTEMAA